MLKRGRSRRTKYFCAGRSLFDRIGQVQIRFLHNLGLTQKGYFFRTQLCSYRAEAQHRSARRASQVYGWCISPELPVTFVLAF